MSCFGAREDLAFVFEDTFHRNFDMVDGCLLTEFDVDGRSVRFVGSA